MDCKFINYTLQLLTNFYKIDNDLNDDGILNIGTDDFYYRMEESLLFLLACDKQRSTIKFLTDLINQLDVIDENTEKFIIIAMECPNLTYKFGVSTLEQLAELPDLKLHEVLVNYNTSRNYKFYIDIDRQIKTDKDINKFEVETNNLIEKIINRLNRAFETNLTISKDVYKCDATRNDKY